MPSKVKLFVCTKGKKCPKRGGEEVCDALKESVTSAGCQDEVSVKETKCMDLCKKGPAVVVMPDKIRYGKVKPKDAAEIVRAARKGEAVDRLRLKKDK